MSKTKSDVVADLDVPLHRHPDGSMLNLHHELGSGDYEFGKARFVVHVNFGCFWLTVGRPDGSHGMYSISTEDLMNAAINAVATIEAGGGE